MTLAAGTRLGSYEIMAPIGAGGMGEIYRARDAKLGRDVALKVLPEQMTSDPERIARFEREAQVLASLNNPNVAQIYGIEDSGGVRALVMELIDGEDLAQRLSRGPMPIDEALRTARQIADALGAAHERGVIHRDLKPANIKVREDGTAKVLDFGLAKALDPSKELIDPTRSPTLTSPATQLGVILGTAAYMAPEQAKGKAIDRRADIWAFGCVLYEMLTGRRAFEGETASEVLAAVLKSEPDWSPLPAGMPASVRRLLRRCLERDLTRRLHDIADARLELEEVGEVPAERQHRGRSRSFALPAVLFAAVAAAASLATWLVLRPATAPQEPVRRFGLNLPLVADSQQCLTLSPDGRVLAFRGRGEDGTDRLFVRALDSIRPRAIAGTEGARQPFFSHDGTEIGFFAGGQLRRVGLSGGDPQPVADSLEFAAGASWADDGSILLVGYGLTGIYRVRAAGGTPELLVDASEGEVATPWALPGGRGVLYARRAANRFDIVLMSLPDRKVRVLAEGGWTPMLVADHVLYQQGDAVMVLPFNLERLEPAGPAFAAAVGLGVRIGLQTRMFAASPDGTLAYMPGVEGPGNRWALTWVDRQGQERLIADFAEAVDSPRLSPDGSRIAFRKPGPNCSVWTYDMERGGATRVTFSGDNHGVVWSPDGERIVSASIGDTPAFISVRSDGAGSAERLSKGPIIPQSWASSWSGRAAAVLAAQAMDIAVLSIPTGEVTKLIETPFAESQPVFSPDGRFVAYTADQSGRSEVYVQGYPAAGRRIQASTSGGSEPVWSRDGRELFFRQGRAVLVAGIEAATSTLSVSRPRVLFASDHLALANAANYDVSADGKRFLMVRGPSTTSDGNVVVVLNWRESWPGARSKEGGR